MFIIRFAERVSELGGKLGALLGIPLILGLVFEVLSRYVFGAPTFWAFEVSYMLMGSIFVLSMGYALKIRQHVNVDLLYSKLPPRGKAISDLIGYSLLIVVIGWMTVELFNTAHQAYLSGEMSGKSAWNPVIWPSRAVWCLGFLILWMQSIAELVKSATVLFTGHEFGEHP